MPTTANPAPGPAQLNQNARTVIEKRYLIKDATGKPLSAAPWLRYAESKYLEE